MNETSKANNKTNSIARFFYEYIEVFVIAACIVILSYCFVARLCAVDGSSMNNTLTHGEMLVVTDIGFEPSYGDIVVFHDTATPEKPYGLNKLVVKRVIATGGETVSIDFNTWTLKITDADGNTRIVDESEYRYLDLTRPTVTSDYMDENNIMTVEVPEGKVFLMGDNRNNSLDSRDSRIGLVDERSILGKAVFRLSPFSKIGKLPSVK